MAASKDRGNALRRWALALGVAMACSMARADNRITVIKEAKDINPVLVITSFQGQAEEGKRFRDILRRANWFKVSNQATSPDYRIAAAHASGNAETVELQVAPRGGRTFRLRGTGPKGQPEKAMFAAVDALIENVFGIPGPCSGRIAFAVTGRGGQKEIYSANFDGTDPQRVTHNQSISTEPSWGRNGAMMVYTLYRNNATNVVLVDTLRKRQRVLSRHRGLNSGADLSPDGKWAALCLSRDQRIELYLMSVATGNLKRVTNDLAVESSPCWSPKGTRICFVSDRAGNPQLYLIAAKGGRAVRLLRERDEAVSPDWSPASNRICFSTRLGGQYAVGFVDMNDKARKREIVTLAAGDWEAPSWSADGRHLICSRRLNGRRQLFMVDTWNKRLIPVTKGGDHSLPSWAK